MHSFRFYSASVLLHALAFLLLWKQSKPAPLKSPPLNLEIIESAKEPIRTKGHSASSGHSKDKYANLFNGYRWRPTATLANKDTFEETPLHDDPNADWGKGAETFERIQDYNIYRILYERVNGRLYYPATLARQKIEGLVQTRIVITQEGNCDWTKTKIFGREVYLKMYILSLLKNVCKENFKSILADRQLTNIDASFHFFIGGADISHPTEAIIGNTLYFRRFSQQSQMEWEFGPLKGLLPIPAVYLNFPWIFENYDRLILKKDPIKEFEKEFGE
jgi:hypothetical protein